MALEPIIHPVFEKTTGTWQYIVACPETRKAAVIDPVLDCDPESRKITSTSADALLHIIAQHGYHVEWLLETHAHADHLTAAAYLQQQLRLSQGAAPPPQISTGHRIAQVQQRFAARYRVAEAHLRGAFDRLFQDDEAFAIGALRATALHLPGHTPDHSGYRIGGNVFTGDSMFNPDVGSARCDFPDGDAAALYGSMQRLLALPGECRLYTGHDYPPAGSEREPMPFVTVAEQREKNKHAKEGTRMQDFVRWRQERDAGLGEPRLLHQALQTNICAGRLAVRDDGSGTLFLMSPYTSAL